MSELMRLQYNKAVLWSVEMSEKPNPEVSLSNDVQVIRNILLGEHLERFQNQFDALQKEVNALKKENKALLQGLKDENEKRFQELTARLEQVKREEVEADKIIQNEFDAQLKEVNKRLTAYEKAQGGLISSLANALLDYKDKAGQ
jgi:predicted RNase H-like nuclease (RuvC/YqgF family)